MAIKKDTLDQLLAGRDPKDAFAKDGFDLNKALAERALNAELEDHLEGEAAAGKPNRRNGFSKKTIPTETSRLDLRIPRDREDSFDPKLIAWYRRRFPGFDTQIMSMDARGKTSRETRCFISSARLTPERAGTAIRSPWGAKSLHWMIDVVFKEDQSPLRRGHGAGNMARVRRRALNLVRAGKGKRLIKTARKYRRLEHQCTRANHQCRTTLIWTRCRVAGTGRCCYRSPSSSR